MKRLTSTLCSLFGLLFISAGYLVLVIIHDHLTDFWDWLVGTTALACWSMGWAKLGAYAQRKHGANSTTSLPPALPAIPGGSNPSAN